MKHLKIPRVISRRDGKMYPMHASGLLTILCVLRKKVRICGQHHLQHKSDILEEYAMEIAA